jgi:hypothetical protein
MVESYKQSLHHAQAELEELLTQHAEMEKRIARLRLTIKGLQELCNASEVIGETSAGLKKMPPTKPAKEMGLTDMVREILRAAKFPLTPTDIRDEMIEAGLDKEYSNILASIHIIIKRLEKNGELRQFQLKHGDKTLNAYLYIPTQQQGVERTAQIIGKRKSKP